MERTNRKLRDLLALWNDKRAGRAMPSRANLGVATLKPWLGNLALIDIKNDGGAVFRLCGTNLHARFGGEMTRLDVCELSPAIGESFRACLEWVCRSQTPTQATHERVIDGVPAAFSELHLPLSDDAIRVRTLLFASYPVTKT
ncbi:MAG: PAS domain-containing protein [Terriglobia bacterium]